MEHDEAIRSQAAERYAAHELSPADRQAFEEHLFDCQECADDVRFELTFAANVRAGAGEPRPVLQPAPQPSGTGAWERWLGWLRRRPATALSFAANLALAAGLGYVALTGTHHAAVARFTQLYFAPGPTKGAADVHDIPAGEIYYTVRFSAPSAGSQSYAYEVQDETGKRQSSGFLQGPAGLDELNLQIPLDGLPAGVHTLVVRGRPGGDIVSWSKFQTLR
jgi:hypothetical protein